MATLFALSSVWLLHGQFARSRRVRDMLVLAGAATLGFCNLATNAVPAALDLHARTGLVDAGLYADLFAAGLVATAAFVSSDRLLTPRTAPLAAVAALVGAALLASAAAAVLPTTVLVATPTRLVTSVRSGPMSLSDGSFGPALSLALASAALLVVAVARFLRFERRGAGGTALSLAAATILLAGAGLAHLAWRSAAGGRLTLTDGLRVVGFGVLLVGASRLELRSRATIAKAAVLAERQRVARDLHDGLAQDLAFIAAHGPKFAQEMGDDHPVVVAARHALAISRGAILELANRDAATIHESLEAVARELRERFDVTIAVAVYLDHDVGADAREHLTRIAREAIVNAVKHGGARNISVSVRRTEDGVALRVADDGCGMGTGSRGPASPGFGMHTMSERAAALGGRLRVHRPARGGMEVEVVIP